MSTPVNTTVTQMNTPGNPAQTPPPVEKIKWEGGGFPSAKQAKQQVAEQMALDTTVTSAGPGKGDSKLNHDLVKKTADPKVAAAKKEEDAKNLRAAGEEPKPKVEPKTEEVEDVEKAKKANAAIARSRAKDQELKELRSQIDELQKQLPKTKEYEEMFRNARKDPMGFLQKAGLDLETVAQAAINGGKRPEELVKLEEMEAKMKAKDEQDAAEKQQAQLNARNSHINNSIGQHFTDLNATITGDADKYEFSNVKMQGEKVPLIIDDTKATFMVEPAIADAWSIQEHAVKELGRVLTPVELADTLEKYYEDEYSTLKSTKKIQKMMGLAGDKEDAPKKGNKKESPTLGGRKMSAGTSSAPAKLPELKRKDYRNDKEFMAALVKQGEERMRILKETKA